MIQIVAAALNTRHTHSALALYSLKAFWEKYPNRPEIKIKEFDMNQTNESIIAELILAEPSILAFSVYIWSVYRIISITGAIKAALPDTVIILGGPEVSYNSESIMTRYRFIDYIVRGEGEVTFSCLVEALITNSDTKNITGITSQYNGKVALHPDRELIDNLDIIPSPFQATFYKKKHSFTYYEASRGCPSKCSYCLSSVLGRLRHFSIERVKADLDYFFQSDYRQIRFSDRTFNHDKTRAREIIEYICKNSKKNINFHFEIQADFLSEEFIELFSQNKHISFHLEIGVQSTNPVALKAVNRRFNLDILKHRVKKLRALPNCHLHLDLLGGLPEDSFEDFCQSLDDVWCLAPHDIQISLVKVLRGTPFEEHVRIEDVYAMPEAPYTVLRTKWLSGSEAIRIQDIGKLVDGIYNSARYAASLTLAIKELFNDSASSFFIALSRFWRNNNFLFYSFTPETVAARLCDFISEVSSDKLFAEVFVSLITHELCLSRKMPDNFRENVDLTCIEPEKKHKYRLIAGIKIIWFAFDPLALLGLVISEKKISNHIASLKSPCPVAYRFEKDLSVMPKIEIMSEIDTTEIFVLALIQLKAAISSWEEAWKVLKPELPLPNFNMTIEKLLQKELIYEPATLRIKGRKNLI